MTPEEKLFAAIFGGEVDKDQLAAEQAAHDAHDVLKARDLSDLANSDWPEYEWRPALLWECPTAVAVIDGKVCKFERVGDDTGYSEVSAFDLPEVVIIGEQYAN